jgi:O-antigen/teichoic acid export membrane protein
VDALLGPLLPAVAGLVNAHPSAVRAGRERSLRASAFLGGAILGVAVPVLTVALPLIYGSAYESARYVFFVLAMTSTLQSVCNPLLAFFNARRQAGLLLRINLVALALDAVIAVTLIPPLGLIGALMANAGAQIVVLTLLVVVEARRESEPVRAVLRSMSGWGVGLISALVAVGASSLLEARPLVAFLAALVLGAAVFVLGTRHFRAGLQESDWQVLESALPGALRPSVKLAARVFRARGPKQ